MSDKGTFSESLDYRPRWPKAGDRLLRPADEWNGGVPFAEYTQEREANIWSGFIKAAAILVDQAHPTNPDRFDLIYPIFFNYRHGLEVAMKWILDRYGQFTALQEFDRNHNLKELWKHCRYVIEEIHNDKGDEATLAVESIILEFHKFDPSALNLRYSKSRDGRKISLPAFPIDLRNVKNVMEGVDNYFSGVDAQFSAWTDAFPREDNY